MYPQMNGSYKMRRIVVRIRRHTQYNDIESITIGFLEYVRIVLNVNKIHGGDYSERFHVYTVRLERTSSLVVVGSK